MPRRPASAVRSSPSVWPWVIANRTADSPAARPAAPSQSMVPVVLRGRGGHDEHHDGDDEDGEGGGEPEDAVVVGAVVHQQADDDESGPATEAQRSGEHRHRRNHPVFGQLLAQDRDADRVERERGGLQYPRHDQQRQRRCGGGEHRADQHDGQHDQQHALLAVQVGQPADQRRRRRGGEQIRGDRPADADGGRVELVGDDAEHRNDGGLQDGDGQDDHAQPGDQRRGRSG